MKILILTEYFPETINSEITGGVESRAFFISKELSKKHTIYVLTSWRKGLERKTIFRFKNSQFIVYRVGEHHPYSNNAGFLSRLNFAVSLINEGSKFKYIDIIDAYNFTTYLPGYKIAKKLKKKIIATYHETWINEWIKNKGLIAFPYELYERLILLLNFDAFISVSEYTKKRLLLNKISPNKIFTIPNGINLNHFYKIKADKEKQPTITFVGRLIKTKRVDILLKALSIVKKDIPNIKCNIIGNGKEYNLLKKIVLDLNLENNVFFLGQIKKHDDVLKIIKKSHIFCSPSILEGFGIVLLEAMAFGLPIISTNVGGIPDIVKKRNGILINPGDIKALAKAINTIRNSDRNKYKKININEAEKYSVEKFKEKLERIYDGLLK